jgi:hypothetical protein
VGIKITTELAMDTLGRVAKDQTVEVANDKHIVVTLGGSGYYIEIDQYGLVEHDLVIGMAVNMRTYRQSVKRLSLRN